jgi:hypothetical protein
MSRRSAWGYACQCRLPAASRPALRAPRPGDEGDPGAPKALVIRGYLGLLTGGAGTDRVHGSSPCWCRGGNGTLGSARPLGGLLTEACQNASVAKPFLATLPSFVIHHD